MTRQVELALDAKATLGEGPLWLAGESKLYWVDIDQKHINVYDPATGEHSSHVLEQKIGAIVPRASGGFVVAAEHGFYFLNEALDTMVPIIDPEADKTTNRFNDGKCDAAGRFWAGSLSTAGEKQAAALYCLDTDLTVRKMIDHVSISNGIAWTADNKVMYYVDSLTKQVVAYDFDLETGNIANKRVVVEIPDGEGVPDGMTIDEEDNLWVAQWGGSQVSHWNPVTGEKLGQINMPALQVTSCTFAGPQLDTLYITSARSGLEEAVLAEQPTAGGLHRIVPGVKGRAAYAFGG